MSSVMNLQRRINLEHERELFTKRLVARDEAEREQLKSIIQKIDEELNALPPVASEVEETASTPALPHNQSAYREPLPSERARYANTGNWWRK
jgi:hypothetical protein